MELKKMLMMVYLCSKTNILIYYGGLFFAEEILPVSHRDLKFHSEQVSSLVHGMRSVRDTFRSFQVPSEHVLMLVQTCLSAF